MTLSDKSAVQFVKLNRHLEGGETDALKNIIFIRATEIVTLHWDDQQNCSFVNVKGVDAPIFISQTPDEMLALMKDENASVLGATTGMLIIKADNDGHVTNNASPLSGMHT